MSHGGWVTILCSAWLVALAGTFAAEATPAAQGAPATFAQLPAEVALDNERVHVERFAIAPGQSTGIHSRSVDQLWIFTQGGILTDSLGRAVSWRDGRVLWQPRAAADEAGFRNTGKTSIGLVCVTLKPWAGAADRPARVHPLNYPNIPGEDLLDNDAVIVQRFVVAPGQWEGPHEHVPNMLFVHIKGGQWAARSKHQAEHAYPQPSADGKIGWMEPVGIDEGHESGNIGRDPIDLIWVTLKR